MIREWHPPTPFIMFSCTEYESPDITEYLRKVNNILPSYNIGKLCTKVCLDSFSKSFTLSNSYKERRGFGKSITIIGRKSIRQEVPHIITYICVY